MLDIDGLHASVGASVLPADRWTEWCVCVCVMDGVDIESEEVKKERHK